MMPTDMKDVVKYLHDEMESTFQWRIDTDPELAASLGLLKARRSNHANDPRSLSSFQARLDWVDGALKRIVEGISLEQAGNLTADDMLSYLLYVSQLTDYVKYTSKHKAYLMCINRLEGPQTDLPLYAKYLPLGTKEQRSFYQEFLKGIPIQLGEMTELLKQGLAEGRTVPKVSFDGVVPQMRKMVEDKCSAFSDKINDCECDDEEWKQECLAFISNDVCSAFSALGDFLQSEFIPNLRTEISASKGYPDGDQYYQDCLDFHTTTTMTAEEIHTLGLGEVQRVKDCMENIATEAGFEGRLEEYMEYLRTDHKFAPTSGEALCAHYRDIAGRIAPAMLKLFHVHTLPRTPFQIVETPAAHAAMAPGAYYLAGGDDRPGVFYVNTSELSTRRLYECESLALHEAIPGHHTQAAIQGENSELPNFRRYCEDRRYFEAPCRFPFYTGYIEGWGLHSEQLGLELGLYSNASDKMGQLSMEALRSCRLVVDTGMHALGWSAERALQFMLENTAMGDHDARTEVTRYITWPGQATAYKVGERTFHRLRKKAEAELKEDFDPRDFYHVCLARGPVPLSTLETLVDDYIDRSKKGIGSVGEKKGKPASVSTSFLEEMTFSNWCKCCVVPGTCQV